MPAEGGRFSTGLRSFNRDRLLKPSRRGAPSLLCSTQGQAHHRVWALRLRRREGRAHAALRHAGCEGWAGARLQEADFQGAGAGTCPLSPLGVSSVASCDAVGQTVNTSSKAVGLPDAQYRRAFVPLLLPAPNHHHNAHTRTPPPVAPAGLVNLWIQDIRDTRDKNIEVLRKLRGPEQVDKLVELNVMRQVGRCRRRTCAGR